MGFQSECLGTSSFDPLVFKRFSCFSFISSGMMVEAVRIFNKYRIKVLGQAGFCFVNDPRRAPVCPEIQLAGRTWVCGGTNESKRALIPNYLDALICTIGAVTYALYSLENTNPGVLGNPYQQGLAQDALHRLRTLFGFGWFFEWEGGRHPLNSTWPWSNVKPSILVLWGVCWMFVLATNQYRAPTRRRLVDITPLDLFPRRTEPNLHLDQETQREVTGPPLIKTEPHFEHPVLNPATSRCDYENKAARHPQGEAYHLYAQQGTRQPIPVALQRHDRRHFQAATPSFNFRTAVTPVMLALPNSGYLGGQNDVKNEGSGPGVIREPSVAVQFQPQNSNLSPQISGLHYPNPSNHYDDTRLHSAQYTPHNPGYNTVYTSTSSQQDPTSTMSLYEAQSFPSYPTTMMHDPNQDQEDNIQHHHRYPSPSTAMGENPYTTQSIDAAAALSIEDIQELQQKDESDPPSPGRSKPIPKPDREVTKGEDGRFVCNWAGCTEEIKTFNRKCEWSKHMDKHDRPYKCPAEGCEKLPGFTYSGGLLRHQREVHNLHGGPRKQLNCPHPNCKRFSGKGFSRQENLNEHLRRVHTDGGEALLQNGAVMGVGGGEETEEEGDPRAGMKRKRNMTQSDDSSDIRTEMARLRTENEELKKQSHSMQLQIQQLQNMVGGAFRQSQQQQQHAPSHQAPQASMM